MFCLKLKPI